MLHKKSKNQVTNLNIFTQRFTCQNNALTEIDFIFFDIEGNKREIIRQFNFNKYKTKILIMKQATIGRKKFIQKNTKNQNFNLLLPK